MTYGWQGHAFQRELCVGQECARGGKPQSALPLNLVGYQHILGLFTFVFRAVPASVVGGVPQKVAKVLFSGFRGDCGVPAPVGFFQGGDASRRIVPLELLGTLVAYDLVGSFSFGDILMLSPYATDNLGEYFHT